jgi:hypothetical protein
VVTKAIEKEVSVEDFERSGPGPYFSPDEEKNHNKNSKRKIQRRQYLPMAADSVFMLSLGW